jgi:hypothetical protein
MGQISTQSYRAKLVANDIILDTFNDEDLKISNNVTNLFDIGTIPAEFSRTIMLPGTKVNNAFFEHVYDISVESPDNFASNVKVPAYLDFDGIYAVNGYIQLNKVSLYENRYIDSYEVSMYGSISSFSRDINRAYLTDLTSLSQYNHTSSLANVTGSWSNLLFSGTIVYPWIDYGSAWSYTAGADTTGVDDVLGAMTVQDFKPAIKMKTVWDAIFQYTGFTYSSSFFAQDWVDDVYMVLNRELKYPKYANVNLETYGKIKIGAISGSNMTDLPLTNNTITQLPWYNTQYDPQFFIGTNASYEVERSTKLEGVLDMTVSLSGSVNNLPTDWKLCMWPTGSTASTASAVELTTFNNFFTQLNESRNGGINQEYQLATKFTTPILNPSYYYFGLYHGSYATGSAVNVTLDPKGKPKSYLEINKVKYAADYRVLDIPSNMPYGTNGIKLVDWIKGIQKKYNLVIYPDKRNSNQMIVETFNNWYNKGTVKDFNKFININEKIDTIPANNLAVNKLTFGDTLDTDYISQQFAKAQNRKYGESFYTDTQNFFSQGEFAVQTTFASSPLRYIDGTGLSGSAQSTLSTNKIFVEDLFYTQQEIYCLDYPYVNTYRYTQVTLKDAFGNTIINYGDDIVVTINYTFYPCNGGSFTTPAQVTIPNGISTNAWYYTSIGYVDCGYGGCTIQQQSVDCVYAIQGLPGLSVASYSPIQAC